MKRIVPFTALVTCLLIVGILWVMHFRKPEAEERSLSGLASGPGKSHSLFSERGGRELPQRSSKFIKKRIRYLARMGTENLDNYTDNELSQDQKFRLKLLCDQGDYISALSIVANELPGLRYRLTYTICGLWASRDKDACLAWLLKSGAPNESITTGLLGIFSAASEDTDQAGKEWVKAMLDQTHQIPEFDTRLDQIGRGWVVSGQLSVGEFVGWWHDYSVKYPDQIEADGIYTALYSITRLTETSHSLFGQTKPERVHETMTDSEMLEICDQLTAGLNQLSNTLKIPPDRNPLSLEIPKQVGTMLSKFQGFSVPLDTITPPTAPRFQSLYYQGVGEGLTGYPVKGVAQYILNSKDLNNSKAVWQGYVNTRSPANFTKELNDLNIPDNFKSMAAGKMAERMIQDDSLAASRKIAEMPEGTVRNAMITTLVGYLKKTGKAEEARQWGALLPSQ